MEERDAATARDKIRAAEKAARQPRTRGFLYKHENGDVVLADGQPSRRSKRGRGGRKRAEAAAAAAAKAEQERLAPGPPVRSSSAGSVRVRVTLYERERLDDPRNQTPSFESDLLTDNLPPIARPLFLPRLRVIHTHTNLTIPRTGRRPRPRAWPRLAAVPARARAGPGGLLQ